MTAQTILPANSVTASGYDVDNSLRFNDDSSDCLTDTMGTATNRKIFTHSFWIKRGILSSGSHHILESHADANNRFVIFIHPGDDIRFLDIDGGSTVLDIRTNAKLRDPSAWYHIVCAVDTTQSTASNRTKIYINGVLQDSFSTNTVYSEDDTPDQGTSSHVHNIGRYGGDSGYFDGYMSEVVFIDGSQLTAASFGEFDSDSGIWRPIDVSGLTFGNNGFYLEFKQSGTGTNASGMGADTSGNDHHFAVSNLTAIDQTTDTCTNNFATLNPLMNNVSNLPTLTEGNLEVLAVSGSTWSVTPSTIGLPKSGKWYYEVEAVSGTSGDRAAFAGWMNPAVTNPLGNGSILWRNVSANNSILSNDSAASGTFSATTWGTNGHIIGLYIDMDNLKLYFAHNGTIQNSGTGIDFQGTFDDDTFILPVVMVINTDKLSVNFGNPAANFAIASGNADVNGFGNFEYDPSAGSFDGASKDFLAICTKNLAEVT